MLVTLQVHIEAGPCLKRPVHMQSAQQAMHHHAVVKSPKWYGGRLKSSVLFCACANSTAGGAAPCI